MTARYTSAILFLCGAALAEDAAEQFWAAARKGDAATVAALLAKGVDANTKFRYGATALSYAADRGHVEVVKILLEGGAEVNVKDTFYGATPLVWAASKGHLEVARMLLAGGADGNEVLAAASFRGNVELVTALLARGGLKPETLSGALAAANKAGKTEVAQLLEKAGAKPPPKADFRMDAATLASYAGRYQGPPGKELRLSVRDGKLTAAVAGESRLYTLEVLSRTNFRVAEIPGIAVTFDVRDDAVVAVTLNDGGGMETYRRVSEQ